VRFFSTLPYKGMIFRKIYCWTYNACFTVVYNFLPNIYHCKKNCARYNRTVYCSSCKVPVISVVFYWNLNLLDRCSKKLLKYHILWNSFQWEPSCTTRTGRRTERQTNMTETNSYLSHFAHAPNKQRKGTRTSVPWLSSEYVMSVPAIDDLKAWPLYMLQLYVTLCIYT
jgi:hypothetical protein